MSNSTSNASNADEHSYDVPDENIPFPLIPVDFIVVPEISSDVSPSIRVELLQLYDFPTLRFSSLFILNKTLIGP